MREGYGTDEIAINGKNGKEMNLSEVISCFSTDSLMILTFDFDQYLSISYRPTERQRDHLMNRPTDRRTDGHSMR